jgi:hypothetical protein
MGNLIIKGKGGAGNKLILQDQAGGAVLTTADSGATIANATLTSPTLNSPTLVTPALGTVSTGNLSNSAIVYPAGHVLQVVSSAYTTTHTLTGTVTTKLHDVNITTKGTGSNFIIMCNVSHSVNNYDQDVGVAVGYKTGSGTTTVGDYSATGHSTSYTRQNVGSLGSWYAQDTIGGATAGSWGGAYFIKEQSHQHIQTPSSSIASGTTLNYALWASTEANYHIDFGGPENGPGTDNGSQMYLTIMEIAT